jgi:hypothetical protein
VSRASNFLLAQKRGSQTRGVADKVSSASRNLDALNAETKALILEALQNSLIGRIWGLKNTDALNTDRPSNQAGQRTS